MADAMERCSACGTTGVEGALYCYACGAPMPVGTGAPPASGQEEADREEGGAERVGSGVGDLPAGTGERDSQAGGTSEGAGSDTSYSPYSTDTRANHDTGRLGLPAAGDAQEQHRADAQGFSTGESASAGLGAPPLPPDAPPLPPGGTASPALPDAADPLLARAFAGGFEVRIGDWMSRGWAIFTRSGGLFLGFAAIEWLFYWFATPIWFLLSPMLTSGFFIAALKLRRNEKLQFSDFWLPFNDFMPLFLAWLVSTAFLCMGLLTCGVLTIYLWVAYQFAYILILDRRMDFWDALEASRKASSKRWFGLFFFSIFLLLVNLIAFLATLSLGLIVTVPFTCCAMVEAYADIFGVRGGLPGRSSPPVAGRGEAPATVLAG